MYVVCTARIKGPNRSLNYSITEAKNISISENNTQGTRNGTWFEIVTYPKHMSTLGP